MTRLPKRMALAMLIGFIAGMVWLVMVRFITYRLDIVHHHADFALYINGEQETFDSFTYYEEVSSCGADEANNPKARVHMHDNVNSVIHVHDNAVTWGHFFANIGFMLGNDVFGTSTGAYIDGADGRQLRFILNGTEVGGIANQIIRSEDVLLIDYGADDQAALQSRYDAIDHEAGEYNQRHDPASCKGSEDLTFGERLKRAVGIGN